MATEMKVFPDVRCCIKSGRLRSIPAMGIKCRLQTFGYFLATVIPSLQKDQAVYAGRCPMRQIGRLDYGVRSS